MVFAALAAGSLLLLVYPFVIYPLILLLLPRKAHVPASASPGHDPSAALIFCAYNEERSLPAKLANIRELKARLPGLDVLVYSDGSTDGTVALLRSAAAEGLLRLQVGAHRVGKASGMRQLVAATEADIVICTDANVILDPQAATRMVGHFGDPRIGTVAGVVHYWSAGRSQTARVGSLFWRLEEWVKRLESATGSTMGASGQVYAVRRALYPTVPPNLLDDLISSLSPLFLGYRVVSVQDVQAFEQLTVRASDEFRRKRRISCRAFNTHRYLAPQLRRMALLDRFKYTSHKYFRWLSGLWLLMFAGCTVAALVSWLGAGEAALVSLTGVVVLATAYATRLPVLGSLVEVMVSMVAVGVGVVESLSGRDYQIWSPAESRQ